MSNEAGHLTFEALAKAAGHDQKANSFTDLGSILQIIADLPSSAKSSQKLVDQIVQLTIPLKSWAAHVDSVEQVLKSKLEELGAPAETLTSLGTHFSKSCVTAFQDALATNRPRLTGSHEKPQAEVHSLAPTPSSTRPAEETMPQYTRFRAASFTRSPRIQMGRRDGRSHDLR